MAEIYLKNTLCNEQEITFSDSVTMLLLKYHMQPITKLLCYCFKKKAAWRIHFLNACAFVSFQNVTVQNRPIVDWRNGVQFFFLIKAKNKYNKKWDEIKTCPASVLLCFHCYQSYHSDGQKH